MSTLVWAGISYGQWTQLHFVDGNLNVTRFWGPLLCHSSATITSCFSMIIHVPVSHGSVHNSWKLKMSHFFHTQQTCHPLSMFGVLWTNVYDSGFQFRPISSNFTQPLKRSGTTFHGPQSTAWSTLCKGDVSHSMRQMVVTPDSDRLSDLRPYLFFQVSVTNRCISVFPVMWNI